MHDLLVAALSLCALLLGAICWKTIRASQRLSHIDGPAYSSLFLGHALQTMGRVAQWKFTGDYPEPFLSWMKKYGGVFRVRELLTQMVVFTDPRAIQHILSTNSNNYPRIKISRDFFTDVSFGESILSVHGPTHSAYRKMLNPLFKSAQIKTFVKIYATETQKMCDTMLAVAGKSKTPIDMCQVFEELTLRVIGFAGFGFDFSKHPEVQRAYHASQIDTTPFMLIGLFMIPHFVSWPLPQLLRRRRAQAKLKKAVADVIQNKLTHAAEDSKATDLLDLILPHSTKEEAIAHTMTFMTAGHETTTSALTWVFAMLSQHPEAVTRIREEYAAVLAKHTQLDSWEAVSTLKFTHAVILESLRLNAIIFMLVHRINEEDDVVPMSDGRQIFLPKGTQVQINAASMHRNPTYWKDPEAFIPERFLEGSEAWNADLELRQGKSHNFHFVPFSAGDKYCLGMKFALVEMQVIIATFVGQFDFDLSPNANLKHDHNGITLRPANLEMIPRSLSSQAAAY